MLHAAPQSPGLMGNRSGPLNLRVVVAQHDHHVRGGICGGSKGVQEKEVLYKE